MLAALGRCHIGIVPQPTSYISGTLDARYWGFMILENIEKFLSDSIDEKKLLQSIKVGVTTISLILFTSFLMALLIGPSFGEKSFPIYSIIFSSIGLFLIFLSFVILKIFTIKKYKKHNLICPDCNKLLYNQYFDDIKTSLKCPFCKADLH